MKAWVLTITSFDVAKRNKHAMRVAALVSIRRTADYIRNQIDFIDQFFQENLRIQLDKQKYTAKTEIKTQIEHGSVCYVCWPYVYNAQRSTILEIRDSGLIRWKPDSYQPWTVDPETHRLNMLAPVDPPVREAYRISARLNDLFKAIDVIN